MTFKVLWGDTITTAWELLKDIRQDHPKTTEIHIVENKVSRSTKCSGDQVLQQNMEIEQDTERAVLRIIFLYYLYLEKDDNMRYVCRTNKGSQNKKPNPNKKLKYSIEVPHNVVRPNDLYNKNGDILWQDVTNKEIDELMDLECFSFNPGCYNPG